MKFTALLVNINATMHIFTSAEPSTSHPNGEFLHWTRKNFLQFSWSTNSLSHKLSQMLPSFFFPLRECVWGGEGAEMWLRMFLSALWRSCRPVASTGVTLAGDGTLVGLAGLLRTPFTAEQRGRLLTETSTVRVCVSVCGKRMFFDGIRAFMSAKQCRRTAGGK